MPLSPRGTFLTRSIGLFVSSHCIWAVKSLPLSIHVKWAVENWQGVKEPQLGRENQALALEPEDLDSARRDHTGFVGVAEDQDLLTHTKK